MITKCATVISFIFVFVLPFRDMYSRLVQVSFFAQNVRSLAFRFYYYAMKMKVKLRFSAPSARIAEIVDLIGSAIPCHDAQVVGSYQVSNSLCLTLTMLAAKSEDYTNASQHQFWRRMRKTIRT